MVSKSSPSAPADPAVDLVAAPALGWDLIGDTGAGRPQDQGHHGGDTQRTSGQSETSRWDQFWTAHASGQGLFHRLIWLVRLLLARHHSSILLKHYRTSSDSRQPYFLVLEIGCGSASTSKLIAESEPGARSFAIDLSEAAIRLARARNPYLQCVVADGLALPFADAIFGVTFSSGVIEHFDRPIARQFYDEHCRVTMSKGIVGIIVPWKHSPYNLLRIACGERWPFGHENPFSRHGLRAFAQDDTVGDVRVNISYGTTLTATAIRGAPSSTSPHATRHVRDALKAADRSPRRSRLGLREVGRGRSTLGGSRLFKAAIALNMASRGSRLGPTVAQLAYWIWDHGWDAFFRARGAFLGYTATFQIHGMPVRMDLRDRTVTRVLYVFREYEPLETAHLARLLRPGLTFIDIGANTGYYALIAARMVGDLGRVVCFEPSPVNATLLRRNVALNALRNVIVEEKAVSSEEKDIALYLSVINSGDYRIYDGDDDDFYNAGKPRDSLLVEAVTLDRYLAERSLKADFIKLDIQGAELLALQGMIETIASNENLVLMAEYWPYGIERCGGSAAKFLATLQGAGLCIFRAGADCHLERLTLEEAACSVSGRHSVTLFFSRKALDGD